MAARITILGAQTRTKPIEPIRTDDGYTEDHSKLSKGRFHVFQ